MYMFFLVRMSSGILTTFHRFLSVNTIVRLTMGFLKEFRYARLVCLKADSLQHSLDNTNPLGPCLVSNNVISHPQKILLKCTVNGNVLQDGTTAYAFHLLSISFRYQSINHFFQRTNIQCTPDRRLPLSGYHPRAWEYHSHRNAERRRIRQEAGCIPQGWR
jgi:hypothetical protein